MNEQQTLTLIDPADIRAGDVVERRRRYVAQGRGPDFGIDARCEDTNTHRSVTNCSRRTAHSRSTEGAGRPAPQRPRRDSSRARHAPQRVSSSGDFRAVPLLGQNPRRGVDL